MKKKEIFRGTATALITPFRDGEIDFDCLGRLIDRQIGVTSRKTYRNPFTFFLEAIELS